jgi:hypothetical protein
MKSRRRVNSTVGLRGAGWRFGCGAGFTRRLVGTGIGSAVRRVMPAVGLRGASRCWGRAVGWRKVLVSGGRFNKSGSGLAVPPNRCMNPTEPPQVLVGTGVGFAVWLVVSAVSQE